MSRKLLASLVLSVSLFTQISFADAPKTVELNFNGETQEVSLSKIGLRVITPEGNFLVSLFRWNDNEYEWDTNRVRNAVYSAFDKEAAKNARYGMSDEGSVVVIPEVKGHHFDADALMEAITSDYPRLKSYDVNAIQPEVIESSALEAHLDQINTIVTEGLTIETESDVFTYTAQLKDFFVTQKDDAVEIQLDEPFLDFVINSVSEHIDREVQNLHVTEADISSVSYASVEGEMQDGKTLLKGMTRTVIENAIENGDTKATAIVNTTAAGVVNDTELDLGPLEHISTGVSNYTGSDAGRTINVEKAVNQHYDNILIPAGAEFAFNEFLGPISTSAGWANAYIIVNGTDLKKSPGGGICQAATTMYRAALQSGMEITSRRNHSMYVNYYATPGITDTNTYDGLDATIYKGSQDLKFRNNTNSAILVRAYTTEDQDAIVEFYGENDGRRVELEGPFTASNATSDVVEAVGSLGSTRMAWKQSIVWPDGTEQIEWIVSRYRTRVQQY